MADPNNDYRFKALTAPFANSAAHTTAYRFMYDTVVVVVCTIPSSLP